MKWRRPKTMVNLKEVRGKFLNQKANVQWLHEWDQNIHFYQNYLKLGQIIRVFIIKDKDGVQRVGIQEISLHSQTIIQHSWAKLTQKYNMLASLFFQRVLENNLVEKFIRGKLCGIRTEEITMGNRWE